MIYSIRILSEINYKKLHNFCFLDKQKLFNKTPPRHQSSLLEGFSKRLKEIENDPFIGYIGKRYQDSKIKVLMMGKSNAESNNPPSDKRINESFKYFKKAENDFDLFYKRYSDTYTEEMKNWNIYSKVVHPFLIKTGLTIEDIAYVNAVPFRYVGQPKKAHYHEIFPEFTNKFITIVKPDLLIPLGRDKGVFNGDLIKRNYLAIDFELEIHSGITRTSGDSYLPPRGEDDLDEAVLDYNCLNQ